VSCSFPSLSLFPNIFALFSPANACTRSHAAELQHQRSPSPNFLLKNNLNAFSKISQRGSHLCRDDLKRCNQIKIMPFLRNSSAQSESASYRAVCVQYDVALSCCLSAIQMATSRQCKLPINEDQRLDDATKLEASLSRQRRFHCS
jgi:hypothetical protein